MYVLLFDVTIPASYRKWTPTIIFLLTSDSECDIHWVILRDYMWIFKELLTVTSQVYMPASDTPTYDKNITFT